MERQTSKKGEAIVLTQSDIGQADTDTNEPNPSSKDVEDSIENPAEDITPTQIIPDELVQASLKLPESLLKLLAMVGEHATAETELLPQGTVNLAGNDENMDAKVVDYAMRPSNRKVSEGTPVKVVCFSADENKNRQVLVRPLDDLYPQTVEQKSLVEMTVVAQENLNPEGRTKFLHFDAGRSNSGWRTVVVNRDMQPDLDSTSKIKKGTELSVVCVRSTLVLQPIAEVNEKYINLVGNTVTVNSPMQPSGKVVIKNADSQVMQAILVDLNLHGIQGANILAGTELTIVGVKETPQGPVLLVQDKLNVLEEVYFAVGEKVVSTSEIGEFGLVNLKGAEWYGEVVGPGLEPLTGPFSRR